MKTLEITIDPRGKVLVQTRGFVGPACKDASRLIEQALGEKCSEELTAEFFASQQNVQTAKQGQ